MAAELCGEKPGAPPEDTDWKALFQEAFKHAVPMLFFDAVCGLHQIPEQIYGKYFAWVQRFTAHNLRAEHTQTMPVRVLKEG